MEFIMNVSWWLLNYNRKWLRFDLIAGLTSAAVVIPKAMAFAVIAGLPVEIGLYTALVPMIIYALLGTSKQLSVSTTTTIAILVAAEIAAIAPNAAPNELIMVAITLAFMVGAFLILASFLRLGFLANFISAPVLTGFKAGIAVVIIVDQIPKLLGIHAVKGSFIHNILSIVHHLPATSVATLILAAISLIIIFGIERFFPRIPAPLLAIILGIIGTAIFGFHHHGIKLVGAIPTGLPSFGVVKLSLLQKLWPGALGIALMSFTESIAAGKALLAHDDPTPNANRELFALGVANFIGSFFQVMPAGGGTTQTVVNSRAGARSQTAELITAVFVILVLLFLTPMVSKIPYATLAAVVVATSIVLLNPADFYAILKIRKTEFIWALVALIGVILFGVLNGILIAIILSILTLIYQANHPPVYALGRKKGTKDVFRSLENHPDDETFSGLLIVRTEGMLNFASIPRTKDKFNNLITKYNPKVVLIDLSAVSDIEYTALLRFIKVEEKLRERGIELQLAALNPKVLEVVRRSILGKRLGTKRMFFNVEEALKSYES
jgi:high affinity sulfate transporter 1